jgi:hypothetical protein
MDVGNGVMLGWGTVLVKVGDERLMAVEVRILFSALGLASRHEEVVALPCGGSRCEEFRSLVNQDP